MNRKKMVQIFMNRPIALLPYSLAVAVKDSTRLGVGGDAIETAIRSWIDAHPNAPLIAAALEKQS